MPRKFIPPTSLRKGHTLMLRTCVRDSEGRLTAHGGFIWPAHGPVECPDWKPTKACGNGLHGYCGTSTSGDGGTSTSGDGGTSTSGDGGTSTSGDGGIIQIKWWDDKEGRYRITTGYVGEDGIEANTKYHLVDTKFVRVEPAAS